VVRDGRSERAPGRLVIAGVTSSAGKTTLTCAILAALRRRGQRVQPFKAGPDYIDPGHHALAAGRPSRNLDSVLLTPATLQALFARAAAQADLALVEGVMGLFDGRHGGDAEGSTAQVARLLDAPVVIVIDVAKTARTAGAIALGCTLYDPALRVAGFILNRVGSPTHARAAAEAVEAATGRPVLGAFPRDAALALPERHLGLVPPAETAPDGSFMDRLAAAAERYLALDRLRAAAETRPLAAPADGPFPPEPLPPRATIAVALDRAFNFYYEDSLDLLRAWGADLVPFSPLADRALPPGTQGVYLGGGFPELFAAELAANSPMHAALHAAARWGLPIYGECGGLMYLGRTLTDLDGRRHAMVGLVPLESAMQRASLALGYRSVTALRPSPILERGAAVRGHEFHYSDLLTPLPEATAAYRIAERDGAPEGYAAGHILASYVHVHLGADPAMARRFIATCASGAGR
jgi:cobyrinic acid a,c-diamide synthase